MLEKILIRRKFIRRKAMLQTKFLQAKNLIILVIIFAGITRLWSLDYPNAYVFDEVYHAFTAKEYLNLSKDAWDPYAKPPEGVAFEWTHPPLAKEFMAISMYITNSREGWAWRSPGAILGIFSVYLVYLLGMKLLSSRLGAVLAAFIYSLDGLNFVQSRTGMNDVYFVTFMLATLLFLLHKKYFLSAIFLGLSLSSKWAAVYLFLIIFPILLKDRRYLNIAYFIILPPIIYVLTYVPYFLLGFNIDQFISLQKQMWWYHTGLKATHGYSSPWWSWPLNLYPVWYFVDYLNNKIANIFASGTSTVYWFGSIALILSAFEIFKKKSANLLLIILGFLAFWLPWAASPRIMFLYHFSPSVPFLALALGNKLSQLFEDKKTQRIAILLLLIMFANFILVYPFLVGIPQTRSVVDIFFLTNGAKNPF